MTTHSTQAKPTTLIHPLGGFCHPGSEQKVEFSGRIRKDEAYRRSDGEVRYDDLYRSSNERNFYRWGTIAIPHKNDIVLFELINIKPEEIGDINHIVVFRTIGECLRWFITIQIYDSLHEA